MDPEGGFFTFAVCDEAAVAMIEIEGDPAAPCVEAQMRQCLARQEPGGETLTFTMDEEGVPREARLATQALTFWFDSQHTFEALPKNAAAEVQYQQLQRHLHRDDRQAAGYSC